MNRSSRDVINSMKRNMDAMKVLEERLKNAKDDDDVAHLTTEFIEVIEDAQLAIAEYEASLLHDMNQVGDFTEDPMWLSKYAQENEESA